MDSDKDPDNFFFLPKEFSDYDKSKAVILPVPYEGTVTYRGGASKGPLAIKDASQNLELYDEELDSEPFDAGIHSLEPLGCSDDSKENTQKLYQKIKELITDDKFVIAIGGEHSISSGEAKAYLEKYPYLSVLQIDAHADLREEYEDNRYSHACVMKRISDMGIRITQVGIRSMSKEEKDDIDSQKIKTDIFYADRIRKDRDWISKVIETLNEDVFITFDLDGLDPSIMPSTGTPEPGGLIWHDATELLKEVCMSKNVVGADFVELAPIKGMHAPDFLAAKLIYKLIGYKFCDKI